MNDFKSIPIQSSGKSASNTATIEGMKGSQTKRRILLLQFCLIVLMHPIKDATVGTLLQVRVQNESLLPGFCSTILVILINSFTLEYSHKNRIENE